MDRSELLPLLLGPLAAAAVLCLVAAWTLILLAGLVVRRAARRLIAQ